MSANIPETKLVSELLKPTGFNCPEDLKNKTFDEATSGGPEPELIDLEVTSNGEYGPEEGQAFKKVTANVSSSTCYCWELNLDDVYYMDFDKAPDTQEEFNLHYYLAGTQANVGMTLKSCSNLSGVYTKVSDTEFHLGNKPYILTPSYTVDLSY